MRSNGLGGRYTIMTRYMISLVQLAYMMKVVTPIDEMHEVTR